MSNRPSSLNPRKMYVCGVWPVCVYGKNRCPASSVGSVGSVSSVGSVGAPRLGAPGLLGLINSNPLNSNPGVDINAGTRWDRHAFTLNPESATVFRPSEPL